MSPPSPSGCCSPVRHTQHSPAQPSKAGGTGPQPPPRLQAAARGTERAGMDSPLAQTAPNNPISQALFLHVPSKQELAGLSRCLQQPSRSPARSEPAPRGSRTFPGAAPCPSAHTDCGQGPPGSQISNICFKVLQRESPECVTERDSCVTQRDTGLPKEPGQGRWDVVCLSRALGTNRTRCSRRPGAAGARCQQGSSRAGMRRAPLTPFPLEEGLGGPGHVVDHLVERLEVAEHLLGALVHGHGVDDLRRAAAGHGHRAAPGPAPPPAPLPSGPPSSSPPRTRPSPPPWTSCPGCARRPCGAGGRERGGGNRARPEPERNRHPPLLPLVAADGVPEAGPRALAAPRRRLLVVAVEAQHLLVGGPVRTCGTRSAGPPAPRLPGPAPDPYSPLRGSPWITCTAARNCAPQPGSSMAGPAPHRPRTGPPRVPLRAETARDQSEPVFHRPLRTVSNQRPSSIGPSAPCPIRARLPERAPPSRALQASSAARAPPAGRKVQRTARWAGSAAWRE